jgi:hypothetical protein
VKAARSLAIAGLAAGILLAGAVAGLFASARYAPGRLAALAERVLADSLGPVRVDSVHPAFAWGPAVEARGVRALPDPDAEGAEAGLAAERIRVGFDLRRLLQGDARVARVSVSGLRATIVRSADGALHPPAARRLLDAARMGDEGAAPGDLHDAIAAVRARAAALPSIVLEDFALRWRDLAAAQDAPLTDAGVLGPHAALRRSALTSGLSLDASGRLLTGGADRGGFELDAELPALGAPHGALALADLDLAAIGPWLTRWAPAREADLALAGRLGAHLAWRSEGRSDRIELEAIGLGLRAAARLGAQDEPQVAELASARLSGALVAAPRSLALEQLALSLGPLQLAGEARLARPLGPDARVDLSARGEPLDVATVRAWLRTAGAPPAERAAEALTAGRVSAWSLRCTGATRAEARAAAADPLGAWPEGCALELTVEGVGAKLGDGPPLRALRGALEYGRDRIALRGVHARLGDDPLPSLDLQLTGVAAVAAALADGRLPAPVPLLPGWFTLEDWARGDRKPGAPSRWQRADVRASRIAHPALLRPIAGLRAVLRPVPEGWDAEIEDGWWGSARVAGRARKSGAPPGRIEVDARARSDGGAPPLDRTDPAAWFRGDLEVELTHLGPFRARGVSGELRIEGARGEIVGGDAELVPRGRLVGEVDLSLDRADHVPASARLRIEGASVPDLLRDMSLDGDAMTGTAHLSGDLSAKLIPRANILRELTGPVTLKLRDGEINQRMNLLLAIAAASDTFNPFRSREVLPYEEIDGALALERGFVRAESVSLVGPAVRLVANGRVDIVDPPYRVEAVAGVFFFKTLDAVISKVPLVNRLLLGKDDNLWAAWFALTGPWVDPEARVLPQTLLTSGPIGIVTEGVPGFVRSGVETLARLLGGGEPDEEGPRQAERRQNVGPGARQ